VPGALGLGGAAVARRDAAVRVVPGWVLCVWLMREQGKDEDRQGQEGMKPSKTRKTAGSTSPPSRSPTPPTQHTAQAMSWFREREGEEKEAAEVGGLEARAELVQLSKEGKTIKELRAARDACRTGGKVCGWG